MAPKAKRAPSNPAKPKAGAAAPKAGAAAKAGAAPKAAAAKAAPAEPPAPSPEEEAKRKEEEEAKAQAEAEAEVKRKEAEEAERKKKEEAEAEIKRLAALANGEVTIKYSMYDEKFKIENHTLTSQAVDELYCLSDVMPGCFIHLGEKEFGYGEEQVYVKEDPPGTFKGLLAGNTYWCYVQQDPEQEKKDLEAMRQQWAGQVVEGGIGDRGSEAETCSCAWGAPCTNETICKDWDNRFANALKAGGNPILFTGGA
eukprot:TRINITY_DN85786_c0_g1_i1.p1 TRINITY_DN85786_c0_g1~~TRINITY_DN85786_c0_g1_i1.p1  ORF type:complete len:255 (+),score=80.70 TRINITY_DN85786_c0_g1_i1:66-830(+)